MVGIFFNQGQVCSATSRLLVQEGIKNKLVARLVEEAKKVRLGNGFDEDAKMGPIVSEGQFHRVLSYIKRGQDEGKYTSKFRTLIYVFVRFNCFLGF
jgi:betaine-aldehyde dehydrogenase